MEETQAIKQLRQYIEERRNFLNNILSKETHDNLITLSRIAELTKLEINLDIIIEKIDFEELKVSNDKLFCDWY
jgi:hypothetical protein